MVGKMTKRGGGLTSLTPKPGVNNRRRFNRSCLPLNPATLSHFGEKKNPGARLSLLSVFIIPAHPLSPTWEHKLSTSLLW
jgi:hypothetical protein